MAEPIEMPESVHEPAENAAQAAETTKTLTAHQRYYALHREQRLAQRKEAYKNDPVVQAKRDERERKKAEKEEAKLLAKEEEKQRKELERAKKREEKLQLALATRKAALVSNSSGIATIPK
jgi:bisphosphoglycerate-independent phosphoglycerate mutase (AlkP superfamily)